MGRRGQCEDLDQNPPANSRAATSAPMPLGNINASFSPDHPKWGIAPICWVHRCPRELAALWRYGFQVVPSSFQPPCNGWGLLGSRVQSPLLLWGGRERRDEHKEEQ